MMDIDGRALLRVIIVAIAIGVGISLPPTAALMYLLQHPETVRTLFAERFPKSSAYVPKSPVRLASIEDDNCYCPNLPVKLLGNVAQCNCPAKPVEGMTRKGDADVSSALLSPSPMATTKVRECHQPKCTDSITIVREQFEPGADGCPVGHNCAEPSTQIPVVFVLLTATPDEWSPQRAYQTRAQCIEAGFQFMRMPLNRNKQTECVRYKAADE